MGLHDTRREVGVLDREGIGDQFGEGVAGGFVVVREGLRFLVRRNVTEADREACREGADSRSERSCTTRSVSSASWMSRSASRSRRITFVTGDAKRREIVRPQRSIAVRTEPTAVKTRIQLERSH